jgi:hypothetical protein
VTSPVGGLTDVGFIAGSDFLLVLSSQGRGIYDCITGERVARDRSDDFPFDEFGLSAPAFDSFGDQSVRTAGIHGGGLALATSDGWSAEEFVFQWPERIITMSPPGHWVYFAGQGRPCEAYRVAAESEIRAFGFSPTGRSFILATSSDITIIARP